jgi:hypothetical protein
MLRIKCCYVILALAVLSACTSQTSGPSSRSGVFDTIQAANMHNGFAYLTGKPTLRVDTFSDGPNHRYKKFSLSVRFTPNATEIDAGMNDRVFPSFIPRGDMGIGNYFDSVGSISGSSEGVYPGEQYYPNIHLYGSSMGVEETFYYYDTSVSRTHYVCRTWVGVGISDTGTARLTDIPIPIVTIP